jgi:hypothetical protein
MIQTTKNKSFSSAILHNCNHLGLTKEVNAFQRVKSQNKKHKVWKEYTMHSLRNNINVRCWTHLLIIALFEIKLGMQKMFMSTNITIKKQPSFEWSTSH